MGQPPTGEGQAKAVLLRERFGKMKLLLAGLQGTTTLNFINLPEHGRRGAQSSRTTKVISSRAQVQSKKPCLIGRLLVMGRRM